MFLTKKEILQSKEVYEILCRNYIPMLYERQTKEFKFLTLRIHLDEVGSKCFFTGYNSFFKLLESLEADGICFFTKVGNSDFPISDLLRIAILSHEIYQQLEVMKGNSNNE